MFSYTLRFLSSSSVKDQVSLPYKTTGKIIVLYTNPYESKRTSPEECAGIPQGVATLHWTDGPGIESR
jgi:hypothetical protein